MTYNTDNCKETPSGLRPVYIEEELEIVKNGDVEIYYPREVQ